MPDHERLNSRSKISLAMRSPFFSLALLTIAGVPLACHKQEAASPVVVNVVAAPATRGQIIEHVAADAVLAPLAQAAIQPKITAPVKKFYVQRGSKVKAGQLLAV